MDITSTPTKSNLINAKNSLKTASQGYELLDRKRSLLIREMTHLIDRAGKLQYQIDKIFSNAYAALQEANINMGIEHVEELGHGVPEESNIDIKSYSVMGVEIPIVTCSSQNEIKPTSSFYHTNLSIDEAKLQFNNVKFLIIELAEVENGVYRLATNIRKTQKRANALKNIIIPRYTELVAFIQNALEEKEREEFSRLKVIKRSKDS
ncbi:MAG: V-type ATP synthase subunit D [Clostridiales bacterium]|jgi:V/A-type H+-transporting ATPase subunit D|nr:V-type ATP synthase subunit D [Clostridiales bacterium]